MKKISRRQLLGTGLGFLITSTFETDRAQKYTCPQGYLRILKKHFTDQAYESLKQIPLEVPVWFPHNYVGFAGNGSVLHSIAQLFLRVIPGRKVVMPKEVLERKDYSSPLVHEYAHEAHAQGFVDSTQFAMAYERFRKDPAYKATVEWVERSASLNALEELVGWPEDNERIACTAEMIVHDTRSVSAAMHQVYCRMLRKSQLVCNFRQARFYVQ